MSLFCSKNKISSTKTSLIEHHFEKCHVEKNEISYTWVGLSVCVQEERIRRGDDLRLQMALEESKKEGPGSAKVAKKKKEVKST